MGKPASGALYAEVTEGRVYVCCAPCVKKVLKDPGRAYQAAYPTVKPAGNTVCPISGDAIPKDAPTVTVQGISIAISKKELAAAVLAETQVALAKAMDPKLVDVGNPTCPVTGEAVAKNTFAVVDGALIRLSSREAVEKVREDPASYVAKARQIAEAARKAAEVEKAKVDATDGTRDEPAGSDK
jgi:hypothetical protein